MLSSYTSYVFVKLAGGTHDKIKCLSVVNKMYMQREHFKTFLNPESEVDHFQNYISSILDQNPLPVKIGCKSVL